MKKPSPGQNRREGKLFSGAIDWQDHFREFASCCAIGGDRREEMDKQRVFAVSLVLCHCMGKSCLRNGIGRTALLFPITTREVQKVLTRVCDYLGYEGISTHSFRKWYATEIYRNNGYDIALVQRLLQHSSAAVTQRYIGIEPQRIEKAIEGHAELI